MKKILNILIVLMIMASLASLALADEETGEYPDEENEPEELGEGNLDDETEEEIEIMNNSLGAEIRLLQLEKAIMKNILIGEKAVEALKTMEFSISNLEDILTEMLLLIEEVQNANTSSNDSVQIYVDLKMDARNLTKKFQVTIEELLDDEKIKELRERVRELAGDELETYSKKIRNKIRQFNRNQLYRLYGIIGETDILLIDEYVSGNFSLDQVKLQICKMINQMTKEKRYQIFSEIKEDNIRKNIQAKEFGENIHSDGKGKPQ